MGALPSAQGCRGRHMGREAVMAALPLAHHSTVVLHFCGSPGFSHNHSCLWISSLPSPHAVSSQPTAVLSLGLLYKPHVPAPSPCLHQWTHISGWGMQGCGIGHLCRSHSVLPTTDRLLNSPPIAPKAPLLSQLISPPLRGLPQMREPLLSFSSTPRGAGPIPLPLLFLFPSSFFHPTQLCGDLSCPFRCPRSSDSVQLVLYESCSICRCIIVAFVGKGELQVLLLLHHLDSSPSKISYFELKNFILRKTEDIRI